MLGYGFFGGLVFENKDVPVTVEEDVDGYTKVSWSLGGFSLDVEKFWEDVHASGVSKNQNLGYVTRR
jgi:hypothetical protein